MSIHYYEGMTEGELVGHVMALADDASELSQVLAIRLRSQTKLRADAEMRAQILHERVYRLEREIRELKALMGDD